MRQLTTNRPPGGKTHRLAGGLYWQWGGRSGCDRRFPYEKFSEGPHDPVTCKPCGGAKDDSDKS